MKPKWDDGSITKSWREFSSGIDEEFSTQVEERLVAGGREYGNELLNTASPQLFLKNFHEEMLDAAAYIWMLWTATGNPALKKLLDDIEYVDSIAFDPRPGLGYAN